MEDWKQELLKRLDVVAGKLSTTGEHLWHILIRQSIATGVADIFVAALLTIAAIVLYKVGNRVRAFAIKDEWCNPGPIMGTGLLYAGSAGLIALGGVSLYGAILELINPEYYALHEILQALGK